MTYDLDLANRLRELLAGHADVTEKSIFGGLAFLVRGNMAVTASGRGGLMVRVPPERSEELARRPNAAPMVMAGRPRRGWLHIDPVPEQDLPGWVDIGLAHADTLPAKH